jgi:hypothetical protein
MALASAKQPFPFSINFTSFYKNSKSLNFKMANTVAIVLVSLFATFVWLLFLKPKTIPSGTKPLPGPKGMPSLLFKFHGATIKIKSRLATRW